MKPSNSKLSRRRFLSTVAASGGFLALGLGSIASATETSPVEGEQPKRVGISDKAYQEAWKRAKSLVGQMTLKEKISQLRAHYGGSDAIARLNIPRYDFVSGEALHGLRVYISITSTSFPVPLALAASWNPELVRRIYDAVSDEARADDNARKTGLSFYSPPTLNLHRDPRWGRCQEAPGEDPCLAATIAVQMVRGMQGDDPNYLKTTACAKHFICNNTENDRSAVSATVDERSFWEYYTRAYRSAIIDGDVFTVMGAYNAVNGVPCCANHFLLTELLRKQWGFRGYVTSDCDAVADICDPHHYAATLPIAAAMAVSAGCDVDCGGTLLRNLESAVNQELISDEEIGLTLTRLFTVRHLLGLFDQPGTVPYTNIPFEVVDSPAHRALALQAARQSLVLLKNESGFLPLDKATLNKLAVIGPLASICHLGGYSGTPTVRVSPFQGIADHLGVTGYSPYFYATETVATGGETIIPYSGDGEVSLGFLTDGAWAEYSKVDFANKTELQARMMASSDGGHLEVHLDTLGGPLICTLSAPKPVRNQEWFDVSAPLTGVSGEHAVFIKFRSVGKHPLILAQFRLNPISPSLARVACPQLSYSPGCSVTGDRDEKTFNEAIETARNADVVILVCGVNQDADREGHDRETIGLTGAQSELTKAIYAANPKTVLVLSSNNSVAVNWEQDNLPAILCAICAGQAQGTAIAEALFGDYNPGGKLPCTWYRSLEQLPPIHDYDIHMGRTYMYFEGDPLYAFGHGLSYTTFKIDRLQVSATTLGPSQKVNVSVAVTNTGKRAGAEVVQLYITPPDSPLKRPIQQLATFKRVELQPGKQKTITFELPYSEPAFWYWQEESRQFVCQPGPARILVGNSSANLSLSCELELRN